MTTGFDYITTHSGKHLDLNHPVPEMIEIDDIARGLANECRFAGQLETFYSVAQHSVHVSRAVEHKHRRYALEGLLHDAAEAYLKDLPTPLKALLPDYQQLENLLDRAIRARFGLPEMASNDVLRADRAMLAAEKTAFNLDPGIDWPVLQGVPVTSWPEASPPLAPRQAYHDFMRRYHEIRTWRVSS